MTSFSLDEQKALDLKDKVVVLTGGSKGIGASTVAILSGYGAHVIFGDVDQKNGDALASTLPSDVHFQRTDVTDYNSLLALFDKAVELFGRVDIAVSNAGIVEQPGWFEPSLGLDSVRTPPNTLALDINLTGTLYFSRIAAVYLRQKATPSDKKSLVLISSVAGFEESPGLFVYQAAKHGVLGLLRSLRLYLPVAYDGIKINVNAVCPWATDTAMVETFQESWKQEGLPMNSPEGVARIIVGLSADDKINGEAIYVEGNRGWAIEAGIAATQPQWLGKEPAASLAKGQAFLGDGAKWSRN